MRERIDGIYLLLQEAYIEIAKEHPTMIFTELNGICLLDEAEGLCMQSQNPVIY